MATRGWQAGRPKKTFFLTGKKNGAVCFNCAKLWTNNSTKMFTVYLPFPITFYLLNLPNYNSILLFGFENYFLINYKISN